MRYLRHLALWTLCGVLCSGVTGAFSLAALAGFFEWQFGKPSYFRRPDPYYMAWLGACWGGSLGAICGGIALFVLALSRPYIQAGMLRLLLASGILSTFTLFGVPVLCIGLLMVGRLVSTISLLSDAAWFKALTDSWIFVLAGYAAPVVIPVVVGTIVASRSVKRFEKAGWMPTHKVDV